jgi:hypothetical protein
MTAHRFRSANWQMRMIVVAALIASFSCWNVAALGTNRDSIAVGCQAHGFFRKSPRSLRCCFLTKNAAVYPMVYYHSTPSKDLTGRTPESWSSRSSEAKRRRGYGFGICDCLLQKRVCGRTAVRSPLLMRRRRRADAKARRERGSGSARICDAALTGDPTGFGLLDEAAIVPDVNMGTNLSSALCAEVDRNPNEERDLACQCQ